MAFNRFLAALVLPAVAPTVDPASRCALLPQLPDPRERRGRRYALAAVLAVILLATLAGETIVSGIAPWARWRTAWLCPCSVCRMGASLVPTPLPASVPRSLSPTSIAA
ncbi:MAG: transposase family protein [Chloroflexota bacterium]|nr:transposase family protein [Chloroflexota bacterium]